MAAYEHVLVVIRPQGATMIRHATILAQDHAWLHADHLSGQDVLPLLQHTTLRVSSWSMFPTIRKGDRIELDHASQVQIDDIVVYRQAGALVCHRVKALGQDGRIITGSDREDRGTDVVAARDIVGRVTLILRGHHRLRPTHALWPTPFASLSRDLDQGHRFLSSLLRSTAITVIDRLAARPTTGRLLTCVFMSCLRFHITARLPVESIPLHEKPSRSIWSYGPKQTRTRIRQLEPVNRLVIQAYLGPYALGSLNLYSGEQRLHPSLGKLGLERYFAELLGKRSASRL